MAESLADGRGRRDPSPSHAAAPRGPLPLPQGERGIDPAGVGSGSWRPSGKRACHRARARAGEGHTAPAVRVGVGTRPRERTRTLTLPPDGGCPSPASARGSSSASRGCRRLQALDPAGGPAGMTRDVSPPPSPGRTVPTTPAAGGGRFGSAPETAVGRRSCGTWLRGVQTAAPGRPGRLPPAGRRVVTRAGAGRSEPLSGRAVLGGQCPLRRPPSPVARSVGGDAETHTHSGPRAHARRSAASPIPRAAGPRRTPAPARRRAPRRSR